jgi:hypothetical protein
VKKMTTRTSFDPERYGMIFCPSCHGQCKFIHDNMETEVCSVCGGFGLTIKYGQEDESRYDSVFVNEIGYPVRVRRLV